MPYSERAHALSQSMLAEPLPRRWAHSLGVAGRARELRPILGTDAELIEAAAVLHDVGYSPALATTGFHPLDGARFLRGRTDADERLARLVAHHSCARREADLRGLRGELEPEFAVEAPELTDALTYCDMTTTPYGERTTAEARLDEISDRYGEGDPVTEFVRRARPELHAAVGRVEHRMASAGLAPGPP